MILHCGAIGSLLPVASRRRLGGAIDSVDHLGLLMVALALGGAKDSKLLEALSIADGLPEVL